MMARTPDGWHPEEIKSELRKRFGTVRAVSEKLGYSPDSLRAALYRPWPKCQIRIAALLGEQPYHVWPDFFNPDNSPKKNCVRDSVSNRLSAARKDDFSDAA